MKTATLLALLAVLPFSMATAASERDAEVLKAERAWLDAYETGDPDAMDRTLAPGFVITYQNGGSQSREEVMQMIRAAATRGHKGGPITTEGTRVHLFGDHTAVLRGIVTTQMIVNGESRTTRSLYTDTWVFLDGRWQVAASHLSTAPAANK